MENKTFIDDYAYANFSFKKRRKNTNTAPNVETVTPATTIDAPAPAPTTSAPAPAPTTSAPAPASTTPAPAPASTTDTPAPAEQPKKKKWLMPVVIGGGVLVVGILAYVLLKRKK